PLRSHALVLCLLSIFPTSSFGVEPNHNLFSISGKDAVTRPEHLGIVNGKITVGIDYREALRITGLYAPPYVSSDFNLQLSVDGKPVDATDWTWFPNRIETVGTTINVTTELPYGERAAVVSLNFPASSNTESREIALALSGTLDTNRTWEFAAPKSESATAIGVENNVVVMRQGDTAIAISVAADNLRWDSDRNAVVWTHPVGAGGASGCTLVLAIGSVDDAIATSARLAASPPATSLLHERIDALYSRIPTLTSDNKQLERLYNRSIMHALTNKWEVPDFKLNPYYATGSVNGGCLCNYLWNFGEVWEILPLIDPDATKAHIKHFLSIDLTKHFAFLPITGEGFGPWYMVNQEKIIGLVYYYVMVTGDTAFLNDTVNARSLLDHMIEHATYADDSSKPVALIDYGPSNSHLELRKDLKYNHVMPDLNGRRYNNYIFAAKLSELMGKPRPDLVNRAEDLKKLLHDELWDPHAKWFAFRDDKGAKELRYTCQMFKLFNSPVLTSDSLAGLLSHWNPNEFLGDYGLHSLAKGDPAYDENDVDNGGPGACTCFPPQIMERLYKSGHTAQADEMLKRILWWGEKLPYWGDSLYADRPDYRKDTPLQSTLDGLTVAQMMIFGLFGITPNFDGTISISPHLPPGTTEMGLHEVRLRGRQFSLRVTADTFTLTLDQTSQTFPLGTTHTIPAP
ncbi:MAG TPA: hypothetical protein PK869_08655, partial [Candidatus Hydrogenedentes bacterium]|nr:hypothetical protein [Candidatus Hydrogenedentota bacterium]